MRLAWNWRLGEDNSRFTWSYNQLQQLLTLEELAQLQEQFTVTLNGNFEAYKVLQRRFAGVSNSVESAEVFGENSSS